MSLKAFRAKCHKTRMNIADSGLFSTRLLLLAMPTLGIIIQCGLFLFGKTCSATPMWISFLVFSILSLCIHWKKMMRFWGLIFLALVFSAFTFSYTDFDAEHYHIPMQLLLKEGWNPVFDSSIQKFSALADSSSLSVYHTLFLPKTVALCGALVAKACGLWIADSFLGYVLLFVLFMTAFDFAKEQWHCKCMSSLLFAAAITFNSKLSLLFEGRIDFHTYSAMMIMLLSLISYMGHRRINDFILAIVATAICGTTKTTGLINCVFLWGLFSLYSWRNKETYWGIMTVALLILWIGMSPLITAWIQYGSPFYPSMTFDPRIKPVDITSDFIANADGLKMGYVARFVYAWISPDLATKACALYYHKDDFHPVFTVLGGVGGLATLNFVLCGSIVLLLLAKKNLVTFACFFILSTLILCPVKYIGYSRYFIQVWAIIPLGIYQFYHSPPSWVARKPKLNKVLRYCLYFALLILLSSSCIKIASFQMRSMIIEGQRQNLLFDIQNKDIVFKIPKSSKRAFTLSKRLSCGNIRHSFSSQTLKNMEEDPELIHFKQYYHLIWHLWDEYPICNTPSHVLRFKWLDVFKFFPHPLFFKETPQLLLSDVPPNKMP